MFFGVHNTFKSVKVSWDQNVWEDLKNMLQEEDKGSRKWELQDKKDDFCLLLLLLRVHVATLGQPG